MASLKEIEAKRAARKQALESQAAEQLAKDLEAIDALEIEHGDENVSVLRVPFTPGCVSALAVRTPNPAEMKRYRARVRPGKDGQLGDTAAAAVELARSCVIYPASIEDVDRVDAARPGVFAQLGHLALKLASGEAEAEGKG